MGGGGGSSRGNSGTSNKNIVGKALDATFPGATERYENRNNSLYDGINYWTFGLADTVKGTFNPEKPLSLQHWVDSGTLALMLVPGMKFASDEIGALTSKSIISNVATKAKTGPKPFGTGLHNKKIAEVADLIEDGEIIAGGQLLPERAIKTVNGRKSSRRPDILVKRPNGSVYGINVGKTTKSGAPIKREVEALYDLEDSGIEMHYVSYD